jgi:hypothetical protein
VIDLDGPRHGLSRHYSLGFTFAPFGNPLSVVHFLAWDRALRPLNMNRVPMTVSDLVKLTREINLSIRTFFAKTGVTDYPVLDGISNGWAGSTIFHQHFQFFHPEHQSPIAAAANAGVDPVLARDDVSVNRLDWPAPAYRVQAANALNTGLVGNDLAGIWRLLGGSRKVPYKAFHKDHTLTAEDTVHAHTQNIYVPGQELGAKAYIVLRDRERVDFKPPLELPAHSQIPLKPKSNIGVLETTGTLIIDDRKSFEELGAWLPADISRQVRQMIAAVAPDPGKVAEFEAALGDLFPV